MSVESFRKRKAREARRCELGDASRAVEQADLYEVRHINFMSKLFMLTMYDGFVGPRC